MTPGAPPPRRPAAILVSRTDRVGDMILATPAIRSLARAFPSARIVVLASPAGAAALEGNPDVDGVIVDDRVASAGLRGTLRLARRLRSARADAAVFLFLRAREAFAAAAARIPLRIGPATKVAQILLNRRILQCRSRNVAHEAEHNLRLAEELGAVPVRELVPPRSPAADRETEEFVTRSFGMGAAPVIVHPGSGGSSINWSPARYRELSEALAGAGLGPVVVTGSGSERALADAVGSGVAVVWIPPSLPHVTALARRSRLLISGSTGVMHVAAAAGCPTVSLFPPVFGASPVRWGPLGNRGSILVPPVHPPCGPCTREACARHNCMDEVTVDAVIAAARVTAREPGAADRLPEGAPWRPAP